MKWPEQITLNGPNHNLNLQSRKIQIMIEQNNNTPTISIVIPTYLRTDKLRECLDSIIEYTDPCEVIVVANGALKETATVFDEFASRWQGEAQLLWFDQRLGYPKACNEGIKATNSEFVILLNDDCLLLQQPKNQWIDVLLHPFLQDERVGIAGPQRLWDENSEHHFLIFFCVMLRRTTLNELGLLDESTGLGFGEDTIACIEAERKGWKVVQVPDDSHVNELADIDPNTTSLETWKHDKIWAGNFPLFHDAESTLGRMPEADEQLRKNRAMLRERYKKVNTPTNNCGRCGGPSADGICIGAENKPNCDGLYIWRAVLIDGWFGVDEGAWLATQVKNLPAGSKILEVGSWHGRSSRFIADNLPEDGQVWCIDTFNGSSGEPEMHGTAHWDRGDHAFQWWWCNLQEHIVRGRVVPVRMFSENAAHTIAHLIEKGQMPKFDLIFIDGDHSEEGIKTDVESWLPLLKEGGLMCGHDYYKKHEGPHWVFVREYVEQKFPDVEKAATSIWYARPKPDQSEDYGKQVEIAQRAMITKWFSDIPKNVAILDVGCGDGLSLKILRELGFVNVQGLDMVGGDGIIQGDMHTLDFPDSSFDIVYSCHSLEHAHDPIQVLSEIRRVLKPLGQFFLILPYVDVLTTEHRARVHCGSETLGLTKADNAESLMTVLSDAGFQLNTIEYGKLREEWELYIQLRRGQKVVQPERPHIFDCFIFNDEFDVLELRLATLYDTVDRFVLVEGTLTHSGNPKPLHFSENKDRFASYLDKITHVIIDGYPEMEGNVYDKAWARERHQRDGIMFGLNDCKPNDIILIGDADEIASPEAIKNYDPSQGVVRLKQRLFYYFLNCENKEGWDWQKIAPYHLVKSLTPCGIRYPPAGHVPLIESGGWHFSFLGDTANAIKKVQDYAHREFDTPELMNSERVAKLISEGRDIFGRDLKYEFVEIDGNYPQFVIEHIVELTEKGFIKPPRNISATLEQNFKHKWEQEGIAWQEVVQTYEISEQARKEFRAALEPPKFTVTAEVCTKDRYTTTLPLCLSAIINQTRKPNKLVIYDDSENRIESDKLVETSPFSGLFVLCHDLGIKHEIFSTPREGQVTNHQHALETATTDLIWRVDDDEIPEPDCLENLLKEMRDGIGAVAGLVHHPGLVLPLPPNVDGSLNDLAIGTNIQWWNWNGGPKEVQHLYSTFLFRVEAAKEAGGYPKNLSKVGHREESWFSIALNHAGYKLIVTPHTKTWHLRESTGGIRSFSDTSMWERDEQQFQAYLNAIGHVPSDSKLVVLDCGVGDHLLFRALLADEFSRKFPDRHWTLAVCFPQVFEDVPNVTLISIAEAKLILGNRYDDHSIYAAMWKQDHKGHVLDAMREFYA